jgi:peroxiredoxin
MTKNMRILLGLVLALTVSAAGLVGQDVGEDAPDFGYQSLSGDTVKLSDYEGKVVFLFLFGNGCPSCKLIGNDTETKVQNVYGDRDDFQALGLDLWNSTSSVTSVTAFQSTTKISYPLLLKAGDMEETYKTTYDRVLVIDQEGKIRHKGNTVVNNDLDNAVDVIEGLFATTHAEGLESKDGVLLIGIFPNPVDDKAGIHLNIGEEAQVDARIYSLTGQEVKHLGKERYPAGSHTREIRAGDLPSGMYMIRIEVDGQVFTRKMVVR